MGGQMAAGRAGNASSKPARPAVRRRAKGVPKSRSSARQLAARVVVGSAERFHKARRACAKQPRRSRRAEWRCHAGEASGGDIRLPGVPTTQHRQRELVWARRRPGPTGGAAGGPGLKLGLAWGRRGPVNLRERTRTRHAGKAEHEVLPIAPRQGVGLSTRLKSRARDSLTNFFSTLDFAKTLRNRLCVTALIYYSSVRCIVSISHVAKRLQQLYLVKCVQ